MKTKLENIVLCCSENNDLYKVLLNSGYESSRYSDIKKAVIDSPDRIGILVLADEYPKQTTIIDKEILDIVKKKKIRMYIEYPLIFDGYEFGHPSNTKFERLVVSSDFFGSRIEELSIMMLNGCWYLPVSTKGSHLCMAKVAGYDKAAFGIPKINFPILFQSEFNSNVLISTSSLSRFVTARYAPYEKFKNLWEHIIEWLSQHKIKIDWEPTVRPTYSKNDQVPNDIEITAIKRSLNWFRNHSIYSIDWKKGVIEGYESGIDYMGRQMVRNITRGDCVSESAMVLALDWYLSGNPDTKLLSSEIIDYVWSSPDFFHDNPDDPMYGLNNWNVDSPVFYSDDNARVIMGALLAGSVMNDDRWNEKILKCLLANLRTSNKLGYRYNRLEYNSFIPQNRNWTFYYNEEIFPTFAPHYQCYLWAAFLWAYSLTGYTEFLSKSKNAIKMTMDAYPNGWTWTNSLTAEVARMILPLAFLVRIENTEEHRNWLLKVGNDIIERIVDCGAVQDTFGDLKMGKYPPPQSNEKYGTTEASLIQNNGDPATDLLYTLNWAFLGLHEAYISTEYEKFKDAEDKICEFLCRIQVKSDTHKYLDGTWMRSFDFKKWEYWGSSADTGWGAWCVESGWVNSWISCVLVMRNKGESIMNGNLSEQFKEITNKLAEEMFTIKPILKNSEKQKITFMPGAE